MKTNKIFKAATLLAVMSIGMTSCNDWLTIPPQDYIVEENFWEDKNDLEGVRYGVYQNMRGHVDKFIIWGDLRSDAYKLKTVAANSTAREDYRNIIQANIDTTWTYYDWSTIYNTIGYCNKVLSHGDQVLENDKQFTASEWRQMRAEMVTLRALNYFYLVRAFKSVPFTTKIVNSDTDVEYFPQLPALAVMDSLIQDVESVAGQARNRFVKKEETKGMVTNAAIYALLSDMYLWRASLREGRSINDTTITAAMVAEDYQKCILNSEMSISKLQDQFDEERKSIGRGENMDDFITWSGAPQFAGKNISFMYKNDIDEANRGVVNLKAYEEIFGKGNSYESIFEIQFNKEDSKSNNYVNHFWGPYESSQLVTTFSDDKRDDARHWFSAWRNIDDEAIAASDFYCLKWMKAKPVFASRVGTTEVDIKVAVEEEPYNNWIIYRLSDVLLNNAEARACLIKLGVDKAENKKVCSQILRMINRRWWVDVVNGGDVSNDVSVAQKYDIDFTTNTDESYLKHVMDTRKTELIAEGKRWFDLVRYTERLSAADDSEDAMRTMYNEYMSAITGYEMARNRCENLWGLYSPIYYMECKAYRAGGSNINQNPVWNKSKYDR